MDLAYSTPVFYIFETSSVIRDVILENQICNPGSNGIWEQSCENFWTFGVSLGDSGSRKPFLFLL